MKKLVSLFLALIMIMSLVACGGKNADNAGETDSSKSNTADTGTSSEEKKPEQEFNSGSTGETTDGSKTGRTDLNMVMDVVMGNVNPHINNVMSGQKLIWNVYEGLFFVTDDGQLEPRIAESYTIADDNVTYTIKLRQGVKFHNGDEVKAADVVKNFEMIPTYTAAAYLTSIEGLKTIKAVDDYTVEIVTETPMARFIQSINSIKIVPAKELEAWGENGGTSMENVFSGTGPYKFTKVNFDHEYELEAFSDYYLGEAAIKTVHYVVITEAATRQVALEMGEIDFLATSTTDIPLIEAQENLALYLNPSTHDSYIKFNWFDNEILADKRVRQAINYAINKEELMYGCYDGYGDIAENFAREGMIFGGTTDGVTVYSYNPEKAKELLAEAGYPDGFDLGLLWAQAGLYFADGAQIIQQQLAEVGITCELAIYESSAISAAVFRDEEKWDMAFHGGAMSVDSDAFYDWMFNPTAGTYCGRGKDDVRHPINERLIELGELGKVTIDPAEREEIYKEFWQIAQDEAYVTALFHRYNPIAADKNLNVKLYANYYYIYDFSWQ